MTTIKTEAERIRRRENKAALDVDTGPLDYIITVLGDSEARVPDNGVPFETQVRTLTGLVTFFRELADPMARLLGTAVLYAVAEKVAAYVRAGEAGKSDAALAVHDFLIALGVAAAKHAGDTELEQFEDARDQAKLRRVLGDDVWNRYATATEHVDRNMQDDRHNSVRTLTKADIGRGRYYTPESDFTATAAWDEDAYKRIEGRVHNFDGLDDANKYFYARLTADGGKNYDDAEFYDDEDCHVDHATFPMQQAHYAGKVRDARRQESKWPQLAARLAFLAAPIRRQVLEDMKLHNVSFPHDFLIAQPFMRYDMSTAILMAGGPELGRSNFNHADITTSVDGLTKVSFIGATWSIKCFVIDHRRLAHMSHIAYNGVRGGAGSRFYTQQELARLRNQHWIVTERAPPSLISIMVPHGGANFTGAHIDLRGSYDQDFESNMGKHYPTAAFERESRGFDTLSNPYMVPDMWRGSSGRSNTILFRGTQYNCTTQPGVYPVRTQNKGHHGPIEYPGCRAIRRGKGGIIDPSQMPLAL